MMEKDGKESIDLRTIDDNDEREAIELVLYQVPECYVYLIPPRKSAASYRADEWDVNKWAWEGALKVISKGEECIIRLEDKSTGELYARAFLRDGEPHPVEAVIDSSRYFVLRVEENIGGRVRHAFIGIGFRERTEAYDFQAALHDHMKYLNKKKTAEEMEQQFQNTSSVDYSLKEGETLVLQLKSKSNREIKTNREIDENDKSKKSILSIKLPPPPVAPLAPLSPAGALPKLPSSSKPDLADEINLDEQKKYHPKEDEKELNQSKNQDEKDEAVDDDFGDFQAAG